MDQSKILSSGNGLKLTLSQTRILDSSNFKECADNSKFDKKKKTVKFSKREENPVGKGEIARYEQFLLFPQSFQWTFTTDT